MLLEFIQLKSFPSYFSQSSPNHIRPLVQGLGELRQNHPYQYNPIHLIIHFGRRVTAKDWERKGEQG